MRVATIFTLYFEICTLTIVIFGYIGLSLSQTKQETKTMAQKTITSSAFGDSKPHYELLGRNRQQNHLNCYLFQLPMKNYL